MDREGKLRIVAPDSSRVRPETEREDEPEALRLPELYSRMFRAPEDEPEDERSRIADPPLPS